jgi:hypothetical protein
MSVSHAWVHQFANSTNNDGRGSIAIFRYPETGDPKVLTTRWIAPTDANGLDWFEADSPDGLSIFGMIGFAAQEAAAAPSGNPGSSSSNSRSNGGSGSLGTANPSVTVTPQTTPRVAPSVIQTTAPLKSEGGTSAGTPAPVAAATQNTAAPPSNAFEVVIALGSWGIGVLVKNLVLTVTCIVFIGIGYAGWTRYRRKKQQDFLLYGKR